MDAGQIQAAEEEARVLSEAMKDSIGWPADKEVEQTLALHVLSPLIDGYEKTVLAMQRQIDQT